MNARHNTANVEVRVNSTQCNKSSADAGMADRDVSKAENFYILIDCWSDGRRFLANSMDISFVDPLFNTK